jgi:hypothetical protein
MIKVTEIRSRKIASPVCRQTAGRVALSRPKSAVLGVRPDAPETRAPTMVDQGMKIPQEATRDRIFVETN